MEEIDCLENEFRNATGIKIPETNDEDRVFKMGMLVADLRHLLPDGVPESIALKPRPQDAVGMDMEDFYSKVRGWIHQYLEECKANLHPNQPELVLRDKDYLNWEGLWWLEEQGKLLLPRAVFVTSTDEFSRTACAGIRRASVCIVSGTHRLSTPDEIVAWKRENEERAVEAKSRGMAQENS